MSISKKILKSSLFIRVAAWIIAQYIKFVYLTTKWQRINVEVTEEFINKPAFIVFWHGRMMMVPIITPKKMQLNALSSNHSDGVWIEKVISNLGVASIKGSSSKGGAIAIKEILKKIKSNQSVAITPDGPRGPARKVGGNVVELAKKLDIPIIPVTFSTNKHKLADSWDNFMVAKPFGKGVFIVGNPVSPENNGELEDIMNELTDKADDAAKSL